jgi:hypothetical protein
VRRILRLAGSVSTDEQAGDATGIEARADDGVYPGDD